MVTGEYTEFYLDMCGPVKWEEQAGLARHADCPEHSGAAMGCLKSSKKLAE